MKRTRKAAIVLALLTSMAATTIGLCACDEEESVSSPSTSVSTSVNGNGSSSSSSSSGSGSSAKPTKVAPTSAQVVAARQKVATATTSGYDFHLNLNGNLSVLGLGASVNGNYDGEYRANESTGNVSFRRQTSGSLLADSTAYVMSQGMQRVKVTIGKNGEVKKAKVMTADEENESFIQKPFVALVDGLKTSEISNVKTLKSGKYAYEADLTFSSDNAYLDKLLGIVGKLGTTISFKGVSLTNPVSGLKLKFNIDEGGELHDFALSVGVNIPVKAVQVNVSLTYEQTKANGEIRLPTTSNIYMEQSQIASLVKKTNDAIADIENDDDYSLDLLAKNELDAGWNHAAVKDSYQARMYKHTTADGTWFNHSYVYNAHHEEDGAEKYKYTIGNVTSDNKTYVVSRKGTNVTTEAEGITLATQFAYLTDAVTWSASDFECVKTEQKDGSTFYYMYMTKAAATSAQDIILDMINSNEAEGVLDVDNRFDVNDYTVNDALITVELKDGKLVNIACETELRYTPTGGEWEEYSVVLNNTLSLAVNENLQKAQEYVPPELPSGSAVTNMLSKYLANSGRYIL